MADYASMQLKETIESAATNTRQLLEDVQLSLHDAIKEAILRSYTVETRQQFAKVIEAIIEGTLVGALTASQQRMDARLKGALAQSIRKAQRSLPTATTAFRLGLEARGVSFLGAA